jgi:hypothetical protein
MSDGTIGPMLELRLFEHFYPRLETS